jgi:hypothetical protein
VADFAGNVLPALLVPLYAVIDKALRRRKRAPDASATTATTTAVATAAPHPARSASSAGTAVNAGSASTTTTTATAAAAAAAAAAAKSGAVGTNRCHHDNTLLDAELLSEPWVWCGPALGFKPAACVALHCDGALAPHLCALPEELHAFTEVGAAKP